MNQPGQASQPLPGHQVLHIAQDPDSNLEALFHSVMNPRPSSWRAKLLPESFFKEPDSGSHSRQSSTDSTSHPPRLHVSHTRSHSSPASLQLGPAGPSAAGPPAPGHHQHQRHQSFDVAEEQPLPAGWEMAYTNTGQKYFLNHVEKVTTWIDPRKSLTPSMAQMSLHHNSQSNAGHTHSHTQQQQRSMALSQPNLVMQQQQQQQHQPPQQQLHHQQHLQAQQPSSQSLGTAPSPLAPSPLAQQHSTATGILALGGTMVAAGSGVTGATGVQAVSQQQKIRLQRIQMERERIQRRQDELMRQEVALCRQLPMESDSMATSLPPAGGNQNSSNMPTSGSDPFLNSGHYHHSREQSSDSGLGLGCYSVPTTPEDFLNNMDEMDTGEPLAQAGLSLSSGPSQPSRFPDFLDSLPGTNVDLGTLDGSDLIPILNDVESVLNRNEPFLTWL